MFSLVAVLVFLAAFSAWIAWTTHQAAETVARSTELRDAWNDARLAAASEESLNRLYRLAPSAAVANEHEHQSTILLSALDRVRVLDTYQDAAAIPGVLASHARYLDATARMFAAVDAGDTALANRIGTADAHPAFTAIESRVYQQAARHDAELAQHVGDLERADQLVLTTTTFVLTIGLLILVAFALILRTYRRMLQQGEERLGALIKHTPDVILVLDAAGAIRYQSPGATRAWGARAAELLRRPVSDILHPDDRSRAEGLVRLLLDHPETPTHAELRVRCQDGSFRDFDVTATNQLETPGLSGIVATWHDVTDRKHAESVIRQSEERYRRIAETSYEGILMSDAEGRITFGNERISELFGYPANEYLGQSVMTFVEPMSQPHVVAKLESGREERRQHYDAALRHKDGSMRWATVSASSLFDDDGVFQGRLAMITDITERKRAEDELYQAQKLESVGRLAAGIAHEINTPIQFIGDNVHFLRDGFTSLESVARAAQALRRAGDGLAPGALLSPALLGPLREAEEAADLDYLSDEVPRAIEQTLDGVQRVATIVRAMKEFAHPDQNDMASVDINQALRSTLTVAHGELKYVADVETRFDDIPPVVCHPGAINQVFLNLLVNAAHAISDRRSQEQSSGRGTITVRTSLDGDRVLIAITDTGCGISEAIRSRIFEQFFATKPVGRGTGQGLALARRIVVKQHGGSLTFDSEVGHGTTFTVCLPPGDGRSAVGVGLVSDDASGLVPAAAETDYLD